MGVFGGRQEEPAILISRLLRMRCMYVAGIFSDFHQEWMECTKCNLTIYHVKFTESTALEQKRLDLWSLSSALPNLWLLLVISNLTSVSVCGDSWCPLKWSPKRSIFKKPFSKWIILKRCFWVARWTPEKSRMLVKILVWGGGTRRIGNANVANEQQIG